MLTDCFLTVGEDILYDTVPLTQPPQQQQHSLSLSPSPSPRIYNHAISNMQPTCWPFHCISVVFMAFISILTPCTSRERAWHRNNGKWSTGATWRVVIKRYHLLSGLPKLTHQCILNMLPDCTHGQFILQPCMTSNSVGKNVLQYP